MKVLITGGTGLVGGHLVPALLKDGHEVIVLTRKPGKRKSKPGLTYAGWDAKTIDPALGPVDAIINLAGAGIADHRWTADYKRKIVSSRLDATNACVNFIQAQSEKPKVFLSASAVGYYGTEQSGVLDETAPAGKDFLAITAKKWEAAAQGAGVPTVVMRFGAILAAEGGAFPKLLTPFKYYAGGHIGGGDQPFPWVHVADVVGIMQFLLSKPGINGPVNVTGPEQHTNATFGKVVAKVLNKPQVGLPVPAFAVKLMLGEQAMIVTEGQAVKPRRVQELGYTFAYPSPEAAVQHLLKEMGEI